MPFPWSRRQKPCLDKLLWQLEAPAHKESWVEENRRLCAKRRQQVQHRSSLLKRVLYESDSEKRQQLKQELSMLDTALAAVQEKLALGTQTYCEQQKGLRALFKLCLSSALTSRLWCALHRPAEEVGAV